MLVPISQAGDVLGACAKTLRRWERRGYITPYRTPGNHRRYDYAALLEFREGGAYDPRPRQGTGVAAVSARVSSQKQREDLARRDLLIKGTTKLNGTHHARQYHGAMVHGGSASLYVALDHVVKGESKVPFLLDTARWLKKLGFKVKWALADREYYCYDVLAQLKARGIDVITVAKSYAQLKDAKEAYLSGRKGRVQSFTLKSGAKKGCVAQLVQC